MVGGGVRGEVGRTSDSPADQRRSMSVNVRGAARTRRENVSERRVRVVVRKCILGCWLVGWFGSSRGWVWLYLWLRVCEHGRVEEMIRWG